MGSLNHVECNVVAHLRKLPTMIRIHVSPILSKEMRKSLVKVLLDLEIFLIELDDPNKINEETPK